MNCCIVCEKELELVDEREFQPYNGGEVKFIFAFGSTKFDNNIGATFFRGYICDDCAEKLVPKMTEVKVGSDE